MKKFFIPITVLCGLCFCTSLFAQNEGEKLFKQICIACHTIGKGKLVGPDLAGVQNRHPEEWIIKFVQSSQAVIKSGDPVATALFEKYNKVVMPDNPYTDDQIRAIIAYIAANSPGGGEGAETGGVGSAPGRLLSEATEENIREGRNLFMGRTRLVNRGPGCNSCHHVKNDNVMAGGALAKDLTEAFTRLNEAGIKAILANPPFPAMNQAYRDKPLSDDEIFNLTAFLQQVDKVKDTQQEKNYAIKLLFTGLAGAFVLLFLFGGIWTRTKRKSVNQEIFDRQIKSV